jgi:hypothetical protein
LPPLFSSAIPCERVHMAHDTHLYGLLCPRQDGRSGLWWSLRCWWSRARCVRGLSCCLMLFHRRLIVLECRLAFFVASAATASCRRYLPRLSAFRLAYCALCHLLVLCCCMQFVGVANTRWDEARNARVSAPFSLAGSSALGYQIWYSVTPSFPVQIGAQFQVCGCVFLALMRARMCVRDVVLDR